MKRLSNEKKEYIIKRCISGESITSLANEYGISRGSIYNWMKEFKVNKDIKINIGELRKLSQKCEKLERMIQILQGSPFIKDLPLSEKLPYLENLYKAEHNIHIICAAMCVPRGTFYNYMLRGKHGNTKAAKRKAELLPVIEKIFHDSNQMYGAGKIAAVMNNIGYIVTDRVVGKIMQENGLFSMRSQSKKLYTNHKARRRNILKRDFKALRPNEKWISDVTYFHVKKKLYFICVILDLYSRKVISCTISNKNSTQLTKNTFIKAYNERQPSKGLIFHSDNGGNYISKSFSECLKEHEVEQSFSQAGVPYDNSVCESFFKNMKAEELYRIDYSSESHFKKAVIEYIRFYNQERPLSVIGYLTPDKFEETYYSKIEQKCSNT